MTDKLQKIFNDFFYPSKEKFIQILKQLGITESKDKIDDFIKSQSINQIYNEQRKKQGHIVSFSFLDRVQMDIIDMSKFYNTNSYYTYVMLFIDVFSRKLWAYALKDRTIESIIRVLEKLIDSIKPNNIGIIVSDNESSFISNKIQQLLKNNNIKHITAEVGDHKVLGIIDRVCRTIKVNIYKYMKENNTTKWLDKLPQIIDAYNNIPHKSILNLTPNEATEEKNQHKLFELNINKSESNNKYKNEIKVGDTVRIRNKKKQFERAYDEKYGNVRVIKEIGKRRVVLDDDTSADIRRLKKVSGIQQEEDVKLDALTQALKDSRVNKKLNREGIDSNELEQPRMTRSQVKEKEKGRNKRVDIDVSNIIEGKREGRSTR